jgi:Tol biopolymer transport system component
MKKLFLLLVFIGFLNILKAQYFQTGQDPASLKWRQINTENFQIIYPDYYEKQAQKLASIMETVYKKGGQTLKYQPKKISIILHTQTVKSNGLVAWAPKRSEFYTIPHQGIYSQDWIEQLAIHEFRHVVQIDKVNSELPKIIKILLGEQGTALVFGAYLPWWFIEGDAVVSETALSNYGRGRFPSFLMEHKALAVEKGNYKYDKTYNGSYKNYVPDHYQLGYYLVGSSREKYGADLWNSVINRVGTKPFSLTPVNKVLKEKTGFTKVQLYNSIFENLKNEWIEEDKTFQPNAFKIISPENKTYSNYNYNHWINDSTIISYRTALNRVPSFVKLDLEGNEKKLEVPGIIFNESVNYHDEWVVWSEQIPDARWQHSGKSFIRLLNIETNQKQTVFPEFTAFAPSVSPDKSKIVVVESNFSSEYFISVYQISDGKLLYRFQTENNNYFFSPEWLTEKEVVFVVLMREGKRLAKINLENYQFEIIFDKDLGEIKNLRPINNNLYFVSSYSGKNSLYRLNFDEKSVYLVYESRFGIESPAFSPSGKKLIVSDYTADGFRLIKLETDQLKEQIINNIERNKYALAEELAKQEPGVINFSVQDTIQYESKKYSKVKHLLNFHSWAPAAVDADSYEITPGVSVVSQNKLGTALLNLGYEWNVTEKTGSFYGKYTFKGWYPVFDFEINSGKSASQYAQIEQTTNSSGQIVKQDTVLKRFTWMETDFGADVRIPLDFSRGKFSRYLQPEVKYDFTKYTHNSTTPEKFFEGSFQSFTYRLYFQQLMRKSMQDVYPNFGFVVDGLYRHSPFGETDLGSLSLGQSYLYLPGIKQNHGIRLYGGIQNKESAGTISFSDIIRYPRGWGKINTSYMYSFASDYKLPVFYPEWSLGSLVYLQRVNASLFADYAYLNANIYKDGKVVDTFNKNISSFGIELSGNANFLRFYAPVEIGFRTSYLPEMQNVYFDFLFSIDFNSL